MFSTSSAKSGGQDIWICVHIENLTRISNYPIEMRGGIGLLEIKECGSYDLVKRYCDNWKYTTAA